MKRERKKNRPASVYLWYMTAQDPSLSPSYFFFVSSFSRADSLHLSGLIGPLGTSSG